jgi:hypothetical protein
VLARVGLDCARPPVAAQGNETSKTVHGLSDVKKRAKSLTSGMTLELDMTRERNDLDALEELPTGSRPQHLPARVDPFQSDYKLSILAPDNGASLTAMPTRAA